MAGLRPDSCPQPSHTPWAGVVSLLPTLESQDLSLLGDFALGDGGGRQEVFYMTSNVLYK